MKTQILFVDDDPNILDGLRRSLRHLRDEWQMSFATSAAQALTTMESGDIDVIVSDMRMPQMDGTELLRLIRRQYPRTVRIILSGQSDREQMLRATHSTHIMLAKPCDAADLKAAVEGARRFEDHISSEPVREMVAHLDTLPSVPSVYVELLNTLESDSPAISTIAEILAQDVAMTAKVLQLSNSAYFGLSGKVTDPTMAAMYLGTDVILSLALSAHVFASYESGPHRADIEALWRHSLLCSETAKRVARSLKCDKDTIRNSMVGGMLHDCGRLVQIVGVPKEYAQAKQQHLIQPEHLLETERQALGAAHTEVGAYLLSLWGLSETVVQIAAFHHNPGQSLTKGVSALTAVHIANALSQARDTDPDSESMLDGEYLAALGLDPTLESWQHCCPRNAEGMAHE